MKSVLHFVVLNGLFFNNSFNKFDNTSNMGYIVINIKKIQDKVINLWNRTSKQDIY